MKIHRPFYSACVAAVLVALPLAVSGCSDDDATTTDDPIPSLGTADGELFRAEITSELCRIEASCNLGMLPDDAERCAAFVARSPLAPANAPSLDPEQSTSCLTALATLSCSDALTFMTEDEGFRAICLTAVVGEQPEGARCASQYDCQAGLECVASPIDDPCPTCRVEDACDGRCATGQHCSDGECVDGCVDDENCADSEYCVPETESCAARFGEGASCDGRPCVVGLKCVRVQPGSSPTCVRPRMVEIGESCDALTTLCGDGAWCDFATETCVESLSEGEACPDQQGCELGLACVEGTCAELRDVGEPCRTDLECWSGICGDGACQAVPTPQSACQP